MFAPPTSPARTSRIGLPRPTRGAIAVAFLGVGLLFAAINTGNNLLYLIFGLLSATLPVSMVLSLANLMRIQATVQLPPAPRAGTPFTFRVRVRNGRRRCAARSLRIQVVTAQGEWGPALLERLGAGAEKAVVIPARAGLRGPAEVRGVRIRSTHPLGFLTRGRFFHAPGEMLVLPRTAPGGRLPADVDPTPGVAGRTERVAGTEYAGLRRSQEGDDARSVDWKSTARRGELMVRETAGEGRPSLRVALRTRMSGTPEAGRKRFEARLERACGDIELVLEAGGPVIVIIDGDEHGPFRGVAGRTSCLQLLARLEPTGPDGSPLPGLPHSPPPQPPVQGDIPSARLSPPGKAHGGSALASLVVSTLALFAYGGLGPVAFTVLAFSWFAVIFLRQKIPTGALAAGLWKGSAFLALAYFFADLVLFRHNPLSASLNLVAFITLYKLFNSRSLRDDRQILLVSLLQIVLAAALTTDLSFVLFLLAWLACAVHAQVAWTSIGPDPRVRFRPAILQPAGGRIRYARPALTSAGLLLGVGALLFLMIPHLGTGAFSIGPLHQQKMSGFSGTTTLGDIGRIKLNSAKVMEVELSGVVPADLRWRGLAMAHFDGRTWTRLGYGHGWLTADGSGRFLPRGEGQEEIGRDVLTQKIRLEPGGTRVLFAAAQPRVVTSDDFLFLEEEDSGALLFPREPSRRVSYMVQSVPATRNGQVLRRASGTDPPLVRRLHLSLPDLDPRIERLARQIVADRPTRYGQAEAIERWLSDGLEYGLQVDDSGRADPLSAFLFDGMPAHCEYFATAMVVMTRQVGIPSRLVAGYLRGERNRFSQRYTVRQSDAHSWVEVYFPGHGWVPFDPTPPSGRGDWLEQGVFDLAGDIYNTVARWWDDYVIGVDIGDQLAGFLVLRDAASGALAAGRALMDWLLALAPGWGVVVVFLLLAGLAAAGLVARRLVRWVKEGGLRRRRRGGGAAIPTFYRRAQALLARRGLLRAAGETPAEFARRAAGELPDGAGRPLRALTDLYYRERFGRGDRRAHQARSEGGAALVRQLQAALTRA